ncbi:MAG: hypothetical protein OCD76_02915 [Reichenbachiella sp.]
MKTLNLLLVSLLTISNCFAQQAPVQQDQIMAAFGQSFARQQDQLATVITELEKEEIANAYWIGYAHLYSSIFFQQMGQNEKGAASADKAIQSLEAIENKDAETHALLGYALSYSISYDPASAPRLGGKAAIEYQASLKKDSKNMRAYMGLGESDFHTPVAYGGGHKVEEYLTKAINLPDQSVENGPTWGKNSAYVTLIQFYQREGDMDKSKLYLMQGLSKYPQDARLNELKQSL